MSKEVYLKKAFNAATVDGVVRSVDDDAHIAVVKLAMMEYARKNNVDITEEEITEYIRSKMEKLEDATSDFSFNNKMMK